MIRIGILFLFAIYLFPRGILIANPVLKLKSVSETYNLTTFLSFYKDTDGKLEIDNIIEKDKAGIIFDKHKHISDFGVTGAKIWGKFAWENESSRENKWLLVFESERIGDEVNVYVVSAGRVISRLHYDKYIPFSERVIQNRKIIFPLGKPESGQTVYFNVKSASTIELITTIRTPLALAQENYLDMLIVGLYYGIMLSMVIYNTFILFATRDKVYLYYVIYILAYAIAQSSLDGLLHQFVFPDRFEFARDIIIYGGSVACVFGTLFAINLLKIRDFYPRLYVFYKWSIPILFLPAVILPVFGFTIGLFILGLFIIFITNMILVVSFILSFKIQLARYYFAAGLIFLLGITIQELKIFNIYIPFFSNRNYGIQLGSAAEALLLSLALGYKINLMRQSLIEKDNELLNAKYTNLKDKMNPHFVLNTLSIIMSYLKRDINKANAALNYFTSSYKYLIQHENDHLVSLESELAFAKDYGNILLIKYADTLKIEYDITGNLNGILIPFLSLQPVIENAFKHGIRKIEKGGISIKIKISGIKVEIEIRNTSNGQPIKSPFTGTLGAIKRRILYFFEDADLTINNNGKETIVKIHYETPIQHKDMGLANTV